MLFHIWSVGAKRSRCGVEISHIYRHTQEHVLTEYWAENSPMWLEKDAVCLHCVQRTRPCTPKQLRACRSVVVGEWVVLCGCGGVRPYGRRCGKL